MLVFVAMGGRNFFLPFCRRWGAFRATASKSETGNFRRRAHYIPSTESRTETTATLSQTTAPTPLVSGGQRRYYNKHGNDDGGEDYGVRDQKSVYLRALRGGKYRNSNERTLNETPHKKTRQTSDHENNCESKLSPRRRNNRNDRRTTLSSGSKKLTLVEFFANLEKTETKESSSEPTRRRRFRTRTTSTNRESENLELRPPENYSSYTSRETSQENPMANMASFFDEVNAHMERKEKEKEESYKTTIPQSTNNINSLASRPCSTISDIHPTHLSSTITSSKNNGIISRRKDKNYLRYKFSGESWARYTELLDRVIEGPKFLKRFSGKDKKSISEHDVEESRQIHQIVEWLRSEIPFVEIRLPTLDFALTTDISHKNEERGNDVKGNGDKDREITITKGFHNSRSEQFCGELSDQKEKFANEMCWTKNQYNVAAGALVAIGRLCAKNCTALPLDVAWSKLKELGYSMNNKDVLHNYLYVASTFSLPKRKSYISNKNEENLGIFVDVRIDDDDKANYESSLSVLNPLSEYRDDDVVDNEMDVSAEVALCHDFLHEATEQSTGIRVRRLVRLGRANEAEILLSATMKSDDLRLRTYAPIFQTYVDQGDVSSAFKLFVKMKESETVILQTETYVQLIACIAENGYFRMDSKEIDGIEELLYPAKHGTELLNILMLELADHSIEITSASAKRLYNAFERGFQGDNPKLNLKQLQLMESLPTNNELAEPDELIVSRVQLDESTGKCPRSGEQLRLINLDSKQKKNFQEALLCLISSSYQERHPNATKTDVAYRLNRFGEWLQARDGKAFTAIVDGPNIAYYMQNFQQGTFNFHQIKFVVDALENMGEKVLVILPKKYTYDRFSIQKATRIVKQTLSLKEKKIRDDLIATGRVYVVPVGSLDDFYWMYASVSMDEEFVSPDNPDGRWPGIRPMLISNDKLRDHKLSLLEPRLFRRWYSNFLVNFAFSAFVNDECADMEIGFRTADFYSREIQGNSTNGDGTTWHFPVRDWAENECLCLRIPQ